MTGGIQCLTVMQLICKLILSNPCRLLIFSDFAVFPFLMRTAIWAYVPVDFLQNK